MNIDSLNNLIGENGKTEKLIYNSINAEIDITFHIKNIITDIFDLHNITIDDSKLVLSTNNKTMFLYDLGDIELWSHNIQIPTPGVTIKAKMDSTNPINEEHELHILKNNILWKMRDIIINQTASLQDVQNVLNMLDKFNLL